MTAERAEASGRRPLSATDRVALVAGSGRLPEEVADGLARGGHSPFVIEIDGEDPRAGRFASQDHVRLPLEALSELIAMLRERGITHLVLAGGVSRRPSPRKMRWNLNLLKLLVKFAVPLARGDDRLLSAVVGHLEENGIKIVGAHEIVPDLLAREGTLTRARPLASDWNDIRAALAAARAIGALDIGQAAIAVGGRAIALEGIEGTDGLLLRVKDLRGHGRIAGKRRGVLVKCAKPGQELRADLPAIGPATVEAAHAAGLAGIAVEAARTFVLDYGETIERADRLGLFIVGLAGEGA